MVEFGLPFLRLSIGKLRVDASHGCRHDPLALGEHRSVDPVAVILIYVQQSPEEMELLFHFLAERYEKKTVVITSNLVYSQWDQIFKNPMTTMAAIDHLVHSAILEFTSESIRANAAKKRQT
jgi:hypothetical protein